MGNHDPEIQQLKDQVSCAVILESQSPAWHLDRRQSSRNSLKYRRGAGEILIVTHEGRGWWDPTSAATGDVFGLVQHLAPGLSFRDARMVLGPYIGRSPAWLPSPRRETGQPAVSVQLRWDRRPIPFEGSPTWVYLTAQRGLSAEVVERAISRGVLKEGPHGSAWFAHRDAGSLLSGIEMRGLDFRGFSPGGRKTLFRVSAGQGPWTRVAVSEAPIDALSLLQLEQMPPDNLYVSTAGGMGPDTIDALDQLQAAMAANPASELMAATDSDAAGERYADRLMEMAKHHGLTCSRLRPSGGDKDWNDVLRRQRQ